MARRKFRFWCVAATAVAAVAWSSAAAAADERRKAPPKVGHNEVRVADHAELRDQIRACWNVPATTRRGDFYVHVLVELRPDGTVRDASIVGLKFLAADPYRRSVAESARGALVSARCNPLRLPAGVVRKGERVTLTFNPSQIFGE